MTTSIDVFGVAAQGNWDRLADILCDLSFLEGRVAAGQLEELLVELALAKQMPSDHPLRRLILLVREAIAFDTQFLLECPQSLFQTLWNRGWWYDSPAAASQYVSV